MQKTNNTGVLKPYNIVIDEGNNTASIDMYGEVVATRPVNPWTGQLEPGNFIQVDEFLSDLEELKTKDAITVHINSVGGDLYAGIGIYNRLKALPAKVTTINDGLAASAGSLILQAGDVRQVHPGSNVMLHQALGFLFGYYQPNDLKQIIKQLEAGNKAAVNIYAEASGRAPETLKAMVDKETWLTGQEAVDAGLADEVIDNGVPVSMSISADKSMMMVNGVTMSTRGMSNIPAGLPVFKEKNTVSHAAAAPTEDKNKNEGSKTMEIKNLEELRTAYPDLVAQAESAARTEGHTAGVSEERARMKGIEAIQGAIADQQMIAGAKYGDTPLTAEQLAFKAMQAQAALGAQVLKNMAEDGAASGAEEVPAAPNAGPEGEPGAENDEAEAKEKIAEAVNLCNKIMNGGKRNGK